MQCRPSGGLKAKVLDSLVPPLHRKRGKRPSLFTSHIQSYKLLVPNSLSYIEFSLSKKFTIPHSFNLLTNMIFYNFNLSISIMWLQIVALRHALQAVTFRRRNS